MYHLSVDHVQNLLSPRLTRQTPCPPPFFVVQADKGLKGSFFLQGSEAEHRISFFAQSLSTSLPMAQGPSGGHHARFHSPYPALQRKCMLPPGYVSLVM